ncbi:High light inducible protein (Modular protein) [Planktothrix agardhii]|jgi:hypothetical protein|uniref:High light inducible protein (Modular protein) n=2 Tax=Planktothrix TaxID=54304 RepID=A0A1J1JCU8_PLAAG|nr:High light inducible protein (Modular protein) [Planktothrix agardhii]CAD5958209.1 High light inducible protein (Modular protein) [Planktothrix agardhii]CAD5963932.1 High light inducible protein (Modular protein) [Planktothrix agardhii]CUM59320.1 High light inducible protein (modular protein) [Planktothrix agardhii]
MDVWRPHPDRHNSGAAGGEKKILSRLLQQLFTLCYINLHKAKQGFKMITTRGQIIEDGGRANVYAVEPKMYVDDAQQFGFSEYAEKLNGRLAMIGFVSALAMEVLTGHGLIGWLTSL